MDNITASFSDLSKSKRYTIISASLLALFLGALDAMIVSAAMPTIVSELGHMELFSWVYTAYFLVRVVTLPIFGKMADLLPRRTLFLFSIGIFTLASAGAGLVNNMPLLIIARAFQGIGAGGIFALVYIVLSDVSSPRERGRTLSLASSIWGISSILGPTFGGFLVSYFSWPWIFWINIPLGLASFWGICAFLPSVTNSQRERKPLDFAGSITLAAAIILFLSAFLFGGHRYPWLSIQILGLLVLSAISVVLFIFIEKRAADPILPIDFFRQRAFSTGNGVAFLSSFAIFSMFAYAPLFIQSVQGRSPVQVGSIMLAMSFSWSIGSIILGQVIRHLSLRLVSAIGSVFMLIGGALALTLTSDSSAAYSFICFFILGLGMGCIALSTLMIVQFSMGKENLGVATASNQFARTLGGTVGVGVSGGLLGLHVNDLQQQIKASGILDQLPAKMTEHGVGQIEDLLRPDVQALVPPELISLIHKAIGDGVHSVFWAVTACAFLSIIISLLSPGGKEEHRQ